MEGKEKLDVIAEKALEHEYLTEKEREIALKILNDLDGTLVIRATSILEFCKKAVQYSTVKSLT